MHSVGFEPTSTNTLQLECSPLDQLGHECCLTLRTSLHFMISISCRLISRKQRLENNHVV